MDLESLPTTDLVAAAERAAAAWRISWADLAGDEPRAAALELLLLWESVGDLVQADPDMLGWIDLPNPALGWHGRTPRTIIARHGREGVRHLLDTSGSFCTPGREANPAPIRFTP